VHLRPEDVHAALPPEDRPAGPDAVVKALDSLVGWGNLRADPDTSRVTAVEDFCRRRFIYQLTQAGEAAEQALSVYDEALGRRGALQAVALHDIVTHLRALLVLAAEEEPDAAKVHLALFALTSRFEALAENARAFMGSPQRTIDSHGVEVDVFLAYKDRLIQYLERFIQDLITLGGRIALLIGELEDQGRVSLMLRLVAVREAADAAPDEADTSETQAYERWAGRWAGLAAWFVSADGRESQARLLRGRALGDLSAADLSASTSARRPPGERPVEPSRNITFRPLADRFPDRFLFPDGRFPSDHGRAGRPSSAGRAVGHPGFGESAPRMRNCGTRCEGSPRRPAGARSIGAECLVPHHGGNAGPVPAPRGVWRNRPQFVCAPLPMRGLCGQPPWWKRRLIG
jgi:uncharacterized protein (TIGR02677 family)